MIFLSAKIIPIEQLMGHPETDMKDVIDRAKNNPIQAAFELVGLALIAVGLYHTVGPVYAFFKSLGESLVYAA